MRQVIMKWAIIVLAVLLLTGAASAISYKVAYEIGYRDGQLKFLQENPQNK